MGLSIEYMGEYLGRMLFVWLFIFPIFLSPAWGDEGSFREIRHSSPTPPAAHKTEEIMAERTMLTEEEGRILLDLARKTIEQALFDETGNIKQDAKWPALFDEKRGTFVTLTIGGNLRGCIGHIEPHESLVEGIRVNAVNAAFRDPRFRPLTKAEFKRVAIEISILTDPKPLTYSGGDDLLKKIRPGVDGLIIKKGFQQATFLPQVWEQLPDKQEFLRHLCMKAGLGPNEWQKGDLEVFTYQVQAFEE